MDKPKEESKVSSDALTFTAGLGLGFLAKEVAQWLFNDAPVTPVIDDSLLLQIKEEYRKENLVFVLGAGVSKNYHMPDWKELLQELMITTFEKKIEDARLLSNVFYSTFDINPLISARYIQNHFEAKGKFEFENTIRQIIYSKVENTKTDKLTSEIVKYCIAAGKTPNLNSIITYNYDDILENELNKLNDLDVYYQPIYGKGNNVKPGYLPIYHVHGYLPRQSELTDDNRVTLGESIYHEQYSDIYSWNNVIQINKFSQCCCVFIGVSLTDPNLRRLLDISKKLKSTDAPMHFLFKKKYKPSDIQKSIQNLKSKTPELISEDKNGQSDAALSKNLIDLMQNFETKDFASFGVHVIWINDYKEIPDILQKIRKVTV